MASLQFLHFVLPWFGFLFFGYFEQLEHDGNAQQWHFPRCFFPSFLSLFLHILKARFFCQASHKMQRDDDKWDCLSTPSLTKAGFIQSPKNSKHRSYILAFWIVAAVKWFISWFIVFTFQAFSVKIYRISANSFLPWIVSTVKTS